jgi:hypothetical protein
MNDENELTPEERMAFQRLPREAEPSQLLEERIVRSLRQEGILGEGSETAKAQGRSGFLQPHRVGGGLWLRPWMAAAAVAAALTLFGSGIFLGQWMGSRNTAEVFLAVREQDATQLAMTIQEAGSAYVSALAALGELRVEGPGQGEPGQADPLFSAADLQQGREVAMGALYGAAYELARMTPDDADVLGVLQILEDRRAREEGWAANTRNVVWF